MLLRSPDLALDELQVFILGGGVLLAAWDGRDASNDVMEITVDGKPIGRRRATQRLPTISGSVRTLTTFRVDGLSANASVTIQQGKHVLQCCMTDPTEANLSALTSALADSAQAKLMGYIMGVCRATFGLSDSNEFAEFCDRVLHACRRKPAIQFRPVGQVTAEHILYTAITPAEIGAVDALFAGAERRVAAFPFCPILVSSDSGETRYVFVAPKWAAVQGITTILLGATGLAVAEFLAPEWLPNVVSLAEQKKLTTVERHYILRCLGEMGDHDASEAARALQILAPEPVRELLNPKHPIGAKLEFSASCGAAGVFVQGWVRDLNGLVQDVELLSPFGTESLKTHWQRLPRPDLHKSSGRDTAREGRPGFVALAPIYESLPVLQHGMRLVTAGGTMTTTASLKVMSDMDARNAVLSAVTPNELTPKLLADVIAPATAELHRRIMATQTAPEVIDIGPLHPHPSISFIIPLYRNLSFLRLQIGAFAVDPEIRRDVELIYVLDSPEQKGELEHLLRGLHVVAGLSFRLVVMGANFGYAAANNTGARVARGSVLMLMNSDVIPLAAHWLRSLRTALRLGAAGCQVGAVGPKLIFDDGSLQHAGLTFERDIDGRWYNTHFFKGYPRDWPAANISRSVPGVTGAAMFMPRAAYEAVGGFSEDYVVGDYEDSDLCLKLRKAGYDIRYEPRAELYHFERRSITLHAGYVGTAASAYNRALHAGRWSELMAELTSGEELSSEESFAEPEQDLLQAAVSGGLR